MPQRIVHAACPHDCPDACGVLVTVEDGRATKIQGDPAHPITRGFLCAKVAKYLDCVYSPDRVLYPMRRVGSKGPGQHRSFAPHGHPSDNVCRQVQGIWQRITWDEALNEITSRFRKIISDSGAEAILPYSYGGTLGALNSASMDRRFFNRLGASQLERTICSSAGEAGLISVLGAKLGTEPEQFVNSRYIIAWASNIHGNNVHLWPFIVEARRRGAKLVVIDPYRTKTAACADWYLPINPGTDGALALAMMHVIIGEGLQDEDYVAKYTLGFEELRDKVKDYPPERVAHWTGIAADDIRKLARDYATVRPSVIRLNYGVQRSEGGGMATRAIAMLPCITGSWKEIGGGLQLSTSGAFGLNKDALTRPDLKPDPIKLDRENAHNEEPGPKTNATPRTINMVELGKALNKLNDPPVKALFVYGSNPAAVCPNHNEVIRGLMRPDLFTVVHEQFLTDTTDYADIVLPATTFFEHKDLQTAYGHYYLQVSSKAIEPLGECRSNVELFRALALQMGFEDACFSETVEEMIDEALASKNPWLEGITRERLEREPQVRLKFGGENSRTGTGSATAASAPQPFLPFAQGGFRTPSGKAEFYSEEMKAFGLDPVAEFHPATESRHTRSNREFSLELLARKADNFLNSTFSNVSSVRQMERTNILEINSTDATARGIADGDKVRIYNSRGEIFLRAHVNGAVQPGVVSATLNWAKMSPGLKNINALTSEKLSDLGNSATFYSVLVEVELAALND